MAELCCAERLAVVLGWVMLIDGAWTGLSGALGRHWEQWGLSPAPRRLGLEPGCGSQRWCSCGPSTEEVGRSGAATAVVTVTVALAWLPPGRPHRVAQSPIPQWGLAPRTLEAAARRRQPLCAGAWQQFLLEAFSSHTLLLI